MYLKYYEILFIYFFCQISLGDGVVGLDISNALEFHSKMYLWELTIILEMCG